MSRCTKYSTVCILSSRLAVFFTISSVATLMLHSIYVSQLTIKSWNLVKIENCAATVNESSDPE